MRKFHPVVGDRWKNTHPERLPELTRLNIGAGPALSSVVAVGCTQNSIENGAVAGCGFRAALKGTVVRSPPAAGPGVRDEPPGVGRAVNGTVVVSAVGIFVLDYLVSFALA